MTMQQEILTIGKICSLAQSDEYEIYLMRNNLNTMVKKNNNRWTALYSMLPKDAEMVVYLKKVKIYSPPAVTAEVVVDGRTYRLVEES